MEVVTDTGPQVAPQLDADHHYTEPEEPHSCPSEQPNPPILQSVGSHGKHKALWTLGIITVLCTAVALGAGLGVGLANHHEPKPVMKTVTAVATSNYVATVTSPPVNLSTTSTSICPSDNGSTYTITNTVPPTARFYPQTMYSSMAYEIRCATDYSAGKTVIDLQLLSNISSLLECVNACASYSFQTPPYSWGYSCSGVAWEGGLSLCWLKSNVTSSSTYYYSNPMPDGAMRIAA